MKFFQSSFLAGALVFACLGQAQATCDVLPAELPSYVNGNAGWKVVSEKDLSRDDQELWPRYHHNACPGFTTADLDGAGQSYSAIALLRSEKGQLIERLIVVSRKADQLVEQEVVGPTSVSTPWVVWRTKSGRVFDYDTGMHIDVPHDSIIYEKMEASAFQYYMLDGRLRSILVSE